MRVGITGASGLIGSALAAELTRRGDEIVRFVRRPTSASDEITWAPGETLDPAALSGLDAVVHLAGAGVGDKRWTDEYKRIILRSRVDGTRTIATAMADSCTERTGDPGVRVRHRLLRRHRRPTHR